MEAEISTLTSLRIVTWPNLLGWIEYSNGEPKCPSRLCDLSSNCLTDAVNGRLNHLCDSASRICATPPITVRSTEADGFIPYYTPRMGP